MWLQSVVRSEYNGKSSHGQQSVTLGLVCSTSALPRLVKHYSLSSAKIKSSPLGNVGTTAFPLKNAHHRLGPLYRSGRSLGGAANSILHEGAITNRGEARGEKPFPLGGGCKNECLGRQRDKSRGEGSPQSGPLLTSFPVWRPLLAMGDASTTRKTLSSATSISLASQSRTTLNTLLLLFV